MTKLETAVCFGKIMITSRPLIVRDFKELLADVKLHSVDIPMQHMLAGGVIEGEASLPERIDESIEGRLEVEFNELYNVLRSPTILRDAGFASRFALVTADAHLILYADVHMT